jgi:hypothetical protein
VLDLDNTDIPLHGAQEGRFFHGYYDEYSYLPLYVFCGRHRLLARQRRANIAGVMAPSRRRALSPRFCLHWGVLVQDAANSIKRLTNVPYGHLERGQINPRDASQYNS